MMRCQMKSAVDQILDAAGTDSAVIGDLFLVGQAFVEVRRCLS